MPEHALPDLLIGKQTSAGDAHCCATLFSATPLMTINQAKSVRLSGDHTYGNHGYRWMHF